MSRMTTLYWAHRCTQAGFILGVVPAKRVGALQRAYTRCCCCCKDVRPGLEMRQTRHGRSQQVSPDGCYLATFVFLIFSIYLLCINTAVSLKMKYIWSNGAWWTVLVWISNWTTETDGFSSSGASLFISGISGYKREDFLWNLGHPW